MTRNSTSMLRTLSIKNYRGLRDLSITGLGRINLLVGINGSGKTSVLEAVGLLASGGDIRRLWSTMSLRGEWLVLPYLYHGYQVDTGSTIELSGQRNDGTSTSLGLTIKKPPRRPQQRGWSLRSMPQVLEVSVENHAEHEIPISEGWMLAPSDIMDFSDTRATRGDAAPAKVITLSSMLHDEIIDIADSIQLTDEEPRILKALQIIDPRIVNFRPNVTRARSPERGAGASREGVILKLQGIDTALPISTLGTGGWKILELALALVAAKGGVLLVDEIDTGLHHTVLSRMWRMVLEAAVRLDVQVFATSHSRDCYESLGMIADPEALEDRQVTIQRIEANKGHAVRFETRDIVDATTLDIELR